MALHYTSSFDGAPFPSPHLTHSTVDVHYLKLCFVLARTCQSQAMRAPLAQTPQSKPPTLLKELFSQLCPGKAVARAPYMTGEEEEGNNRFGRQSLNDLP